MRDLNLNLQDYITLLNLMFGFTAIIAAHNSKILLALTCIILAIIADSLDGIVTRRRKSARKFGAELDSLSDMSSFGIATAFIFYSVYSSIPLTFTIFLFPLCAAVRLARFNVTGGGKHFTGLPTPVAGGLLASLTLLEGILHPLIVVSSIFLLSYLMVSSLKFPSYRGIRYSRPPLSWALMMGSWILVIFNTKLMFLPFALYLLNGVIFWISGSLEE